jgi:D-3-phosphoglycerate dehydrogenase
MMKDGVRILNFARGDLVNSDDLLAALDAGKVAAYVTDFPSDEMIGADGVVCIPHLGASTPESEDNCAIMAADELMEYIEKGNIVNSVNMPNVSMPMSGDERICVIHKNVPAVINKISGVVSAANININHMLNKSKNDVAYSMLDIEEKDMAKVNAIATEIEAMPEVIKVRVI